MAKLGHYGAKKSLYPAAFNQVIITVTVDLLQIEF